MSEKKLKRPWDPIWPEDFDDLRNMSKTTFLLRQLYRINRNHKTDICELSEYEIQRQTGWNRQTIRAAKHNLISLGEIVPQGSFTFLIKPFHRYPDTKTGQKPSYFRESQQDKKYPAKGQKLSYQQDKNCPVVGQKLSCFNLSIDRDNIDKDNNSSQSSLKPETTESVSRLDMLKPEGIRTLRMLYGNNVVALKAKLALMGITEAEADLALGRA